MNACIVSSSGFIHAAEFSVFQLVIQERSTQLVLAKVIEPLVGDMCLAQVFYSRHLLPRTLGVGCVIQTPELSPISQP